jgi:hypothetical protein
VRATLAGRREVSVLIDEEIRLDDVQLDDVDVEELLVVLLGEPELDRVEMCAQCVGECKVF